MGFAIANVRKAHDYLTGGGFTEATGGVVPPMTTEAACGLIGGWTVETGDPELRDLDVVEVGNGQKGRGMSSTQVYAGMPMTKHERHLHVVKMSTHLIGSLDMQLMNTPVNTMSVVNHFLVGPVLFKSTVNQMTFVQLLLD